MKTPIVIALALALAALAGAANITLADGRVLHNASVIGVASGSVTIQSDSGVEEVAHDQLPDSLRSQYAAPAPRRSYSSQAAQTSGGVVAQMSGDGSRKSAPFRVSGRWVVRWRTAATQPRLLGPSFFVGVIPCNGGSAFASASTERMGDGETWGSGSGEAQLTVGGLECTWSVTVEQL